ncbi:MAG: SH3 domain-containing protein [Candidatus Riflebacteria bacterium]|nr:SH3 domain-containing protein [Candidatus Riflebacteria bacterium]
MKKAKIISIVVIMLSVIALGVFMGKQMFKLMEAGSATPGQTVVAGGDNATSSVKILYSADKPGETTSTIAAPTVIESGANIATSEVALAKEPEKADDSGFDPKGPKWFAYASGDGINVRSGSSVQDKLLFKVAKGTRGSVIEKKNGWTHIKWDFNRKEGWVRDDLLVQGPAAVMQTMVANTEDITKLDLNKITKETAKEVLKENRIAVALAKPAPVSETVKTFVDGENLPEQARIEVVTFANIRSGPSVRDDMVAKLPKGMAVKIKSVKKIGKWQWFEILFQDGKKSGWTREDNLKF